MLFKNGGQVVLVHKAQADGAGGLAVAAVDTGPAHAVGHGQRTAGRQMAAENSDDLLRIGKMGEGVVDHDAVKLFAEISGLRIST